MENVQSSQAYASFLSRVVASIIDVMILALITIPILTAIYGMEYLSLENEKIVMGIWEIVFNVIFPIVSVLIFWYYKSATPGKIALHLIIVDAKTGEKPSIGQFVIRYFSYLIAMLPLGIGIFWIAFDKKRQGWHDKLAGTVVTDTSNQPN